MLLCSPTFLGVRSFRCSMRKWTGEMWWRLTLLISVPGPVWPPCVPLKRGRSIIRRGEGGAWLYFHLDGVRRWRHVIGGESSVLTTGSESLDHGVYHQIKFTKKICQAFKMEVKTSSDLREFFFFLECFQILFVILGGKVTIYFVWVVFNHHF